MNKYKRMYIISKSKGIANAYTSYHVDSVKGFPDIIGNFLNRTGTPNAWDDFIEQVNKAIVVAEDNVLRMTEAQKISKRIEKIVSDFIQPLLDIETVAPDIWRGGGFNKIVNKQIVSSVNAFTHTDSDYISKVGQVYNYTVYLLERLEELSRQAVLRKNATGKSITTGDVDYIFESKSLRISGTNKFKAGILDTLLRRGSVTPSYYSTLLTQVDEATLLLDDADEEFLRLTDEQGLLDGDIDGVSISMGYLKNVSPKLFKSKEFNSFVNNQMIPLINEINYPQDVTLANIDNVNIQLVNMRKYVNALRQDIQSNF